MRKFTPDERHAIRRNHTNCVKGETWKFTDRLYSKKCIGCLPGYWGCRSGNARDSKLNFEIRVEPVEGGLHFYLGGHIPELIPGSNGIRLGTILDYTVLYADVLATGKDDCGDHVEDEKGAIDLVTVSFFCAVTSIIAGYSWFCDGLEELLDGTRPGKFDHTRTTRELMKE